MNAQEAQMLQSFLDSLVQVRGVTKDREAEALIARAVSQQPDAAYLLVQRALLQDQAIEAAQARLAELERQVTQLQSTGAKAPAAASSSFLSGGGWGRQASVAAAAPARDVSVTGQPLPAARLAPAQAAAAAPARGGAGSFLPAMAATAAGVVGGAFLYQGIQHLLNRNDTTGNAAAAGSDTSISEGSFADPVSPLEQHDQFAALEDGDSLADGASFDSDDYT